MDKILDARYYCDKQPKLNLWLTGEFQQSADNNCTRENLQILLSQAISKKVKNIMD